MGSALKNLFTNIIKRKFTLKKKALNRSYGGDIFIYLILIISGLFMVIPMVYAISMSLKPLDELWFFPPRLIVINPTLRNYQDLFKLMATSWVPFSRYVFNTAFVAIIGTIGHIIISSMCAYALSKHRFKGSNVIFAIIILALMFNQAVTVIPNFIIMSYIGWIDTYRSIIIPAFAAPLGLYLMKQFIDQMIPDSLLESARMDGSSELRTFWTIVMPLVKPAWLTLTMFSFQALWNMGGNIYIQSENLKSLNFALSQILAGGIARAGTGSAAAVFMMIIPVTVFVVTQRNIVETMSTSGMKE